MKDKWVAFLSLNLLAAGLVLPLPAVAACVAARAGDKYSGNFEILSDGGLPVLAGVVSETFTSSSGGTCSFWFSPVDGSNTTLSTQTSNCTFTVRNFSTITCSGDFTLSVGGVVQHSGRYVMGSGGSATYYIGLLQGASPLIIKSSTQKQ